MWIRWIHLSKHNLVRIQYRLSSILETTNYTFIWTICIMTTHLINQTWEFISFMLWCFMHIISCVQNFFILDGYTLLLRIHFFIIKKQILRKVTIIDIIWLLNDFRMLIHDSYWLLMFVCYSNSL